MKTYINKIHYSNKLIFKQYVAKILLMGCTPFYTVANSFRMLLYKYNILKTHKLPAYVISIGNLTTGGTGKTPLTIAIANYIKEKLHKNVVVLSRGYGGSLSSKDVNIISNGKNILFSSKEAGDEPYLIASKTDFTPVITGSSRIKSGLFAINDFNADILLLDDGYQHIKLYRDLNILVIDAEKKFGNSLLLPAGPLREPLSMINRADKIILIDKNPNNPEKTEDIQKFADYLKNKFNKPVFMCNFKYGDIYNIKNGEILANSTQDDENQKIANYDKEGHDWGQYGQRHHVAAFAGIAHPEPFYNYLSQSGYNLVMTEDFTDHYMYSSQDILRIVNQAKNLGATAIITTEKDCVKLIDIIKDLDLEIPIFALKLEVDLDLDGLLGLWNNDTKNDEDTRC